LGLTKVKGENKQLTGEMMNFTFDFKENNLGRLAPHLFIFLAALVQVVAIFVLWGIALLQNRQ